MEISMLTEKELSSIIINAIVVKILMAYPRAFILRSGNAAWISVIFSVLFAALLFGVVRLIYNSRYNVIDLAERIGGKVLRIITAAAVIAMMGINFFTIMRIVPEFIRLVLLKETYVEIIFIGFIITLILGAVCGIESIGRVHRIFVPIAGGIFVIFVLLLIPSFRIDYLFPIFGNGTSAIIKDSISGLSIFSDLLVLNILISKTKNSEDHKIAGTKSILIGGLFVVITVLSYCLSYVYPVSTDFIMPVYQLERLIHLSNFFSRFEAGFQFIWCISVMFYGSMYLAVMSEVWKSGFGHKHSKPAILPIAVCLAGAALIPKTFTDAAQLQIQINKWLYIPVFLIPIVLAFADKIKNKSK